MDTTLRQAEEDEKDNETDQGLRPRIEELKARIDVLNNRAAGFIKEHPAACLLGALGLGYLIARIARRRS
jgi:hypothetical protein